MSVCFKSAIISVLIARSHSHDNHVNATAPCMPCTRIHMHFAQARPPMFCIPLVIYFVPFLTKLEVYTATSEHKECHCHRKEATEFVCMGYSITVEALHYSCLLSSLSAWLDKVDLLPCQWNYSFCAVLLSPNPKLPRCSAGLCCTIPRLERLGRSEVLIPTLSYHQCYTVLLPSFLVLPDLQAWCTGSIVEEKGLILITFIPCVYNREFCKLVVKTDVHV